MMELVRTWLLGITGAAILAALADGLMPEGGVKQVGRLVCGLVLLAAVLRPLGSVKVTDLSGQWEYDGQQLQQYKQQLQEGVDENMKAVIEEQLAAYSMDKAAQLGIHCQIEVCCELGEDGVFFPACAQISGVIQPEERQTLEQMMMEDLGLSAKKLVFREEGQG